MQEEIHNPFIFRHTLGKVRKIPAGCSQHSQKHASQHHSRDVASHILPRYAATDDTPQHGKKFCSFIKPFLAHLAAAVENPALFRLHHAKQLSPPIKKTHDLFARSYKLSFEFIVRPDLRMQYFAQFLESGTCSLKEKIVLVPEIAVNRPLADPGVTGDVIHGNFMQPLAYKKLLG